MSLLSRVQQLVDQRQLRSGKKQNISFDESDGSFVIFNKTGQPVRSYKPTVTATLFHNDNDFVRFVMGPYGSGKSTLCTAEIIKRAIEIPACTDGIRRSRCVIVRNSLPDLLLSAIPMWDFWFGELGDIHIRKDSPYCYHHTFNDGKGLIILEVYFISGDENPKKLDKFLSTAFTMAYLNEASALPEVLLDRIKGRVGRFPARKDENVELASDVIDQEYWNGVLLDSNPPSERHWLHELFITKRPPGFKLYVQPPGLLEEEKTDETSKELNLLMDEKGNYVANPDADNIHFLGKDYYVNMAKGADTEFIRTACQGQFGLTRSGKVVYPNYSDDLHSVASIEFDVDEPLIISLDYGLTPACLISQFINGQLRVIKEFVSGFNVSVEELVAQRVRPYLDMFCKDMHIQLVTGDPSNTPGQATKTTPAQVVEDELGIAVTPAPTNRIQPRIDSVKFFLNRLVAGKAALLISRTGCPVLREGFMAEYKYEEVQKADGLEPKEIPAKTHPHSDIHDALQYAALGCHNDYTNLDDGIDADSFMRHRVNQGSWLGARS